MSATVTDILGKGFAYEQTAETQKLPAATGTILSGVGAANWGPIGLPVFLQTGLQGFQKSFGTTIGANESKDSSYLMMAYHFLSSSRGWYTRVAEGAVKSSLEWYIPDQAPQLLGTKVVKNKDFLLYDETDGIKENNKMTIRATADDGGTPVAIDADIVLEPSKKALLVTESQTLPGGTVKSSYQKNTILKIQDGNDVLTNEYAYTVVNADAFTSLKADVEAETYANFSIAWIRAALKYLIKTDLSVIPSKIFKIVNYQNRTNDGKLHGPLKLTKVQALVHEAKGELSFIAREFVDKAFDVASATNTDITGLNGKYILLKAGTYTATFTGLVGTVITPGGGTQNAIYQVAVSGSSVALTLLSISPSPSEFVLIDDVASGLGSLADDTYFTITSNGVIDDEATIATGQKVLIKGLTNQKRDIYNYSSALTYVAYSNSPKVIIGALYVNHTGGNNTLLKFDGSNYQDVTPGTNNYYIKGVNTYFSVPPVPGTWTASAALSDGDKLIEVDAGSIIEWQTSAYITTDEYADLNPYIDDGGGLKANIYYKYKTSTQEFVPVTVTNGEYGLSAGTYAGTVFTDDTAVFQYTNGQFNVPYPGQAEGDVWISVNKGTLVYKTATNFEQRYNNYDTSTDNVVVFESSNRGSKAFVRVVESMANLFRLGDVSKAYGLNTPISTILDNINYQTSQTYQQYLIDNALPSNLNPAAIPSELDRLVVATIDSSNVLLLTTQQTGSDIKLRLNKLSGANLGDISSKNAYSVLGLPNVGNVTAYPTGYVEVMGIDQEFVGSFEAFYTGTDGNTIKFVNSKTQDGINLKVYFKGSLLAVFTNYSYNVAASNYIGKLISEDPNTKEVITMTNLVTGKEFPFGTFTFSGGSSGGFPSDEIYGAEVTKYQNVDLYDFDILCVSGLNSNAIVSKIKEVCEYRKDCLGIIDPPQAMSVAGVLQWANGSGDGNDDTTDDIVKLDSPYLATYYPWVNIPVTTNGSTVYQWHAPSVRVAGSIAKNDNAQGHKVGAPAGIRTKFTDVAAIEIYLEEEDKTRLYADVYDACINPIVFTTTDGFFMDGQKTTHRNRDALRRINVARAGMYIKKRVAEAAKLYFWNPTDPASWADYGVLLGGILNQLVNWRAAADNYEIITDASVNTDEVVNNNGMIGIINWTPTKVVERLKTISNIKENETTVTTQVV